MLKQFTDQPLFVRLLKEKLTMTALVVVMFYTVVALLVHYEIVGKDWDVPVGASYEPPNGTHWLGTDIFGRSVAIKIIKSTAVAMKVGFIVSILSVTLGVILGSLAGFFGGFVDEMVVWICTTLASIPNIMLLIALTFVLGKGPSAIYIALSMTNWTDLCRLVRSEVIRHKGREYVQAAMAIGASSFRKLFIHIFPNVFHIVIVQLSAIFQSAIKSEVILSFLGLGIQNSPSWGVMINDSKSELSGGIWWQLTFATAAMFLIVLAFNIMTDALRDALDPKLRGK